MKLFFMYVMLAVMLYNPGVFGADESLRLIVILENNNVNVLKKEMPFCSGSIVKSGNELFLATAAHCFGRSIQVMIHQVYRYAQYHKLNNSSFNIYAQLLEGSKFSKKIKIFNYNLNDKAGPILSGLSNKDFHGDGILIKLDLSEEELSGLGFKILNLPKGNFTDTNLTISGFPHGKHARKECQLADFEKLYKELSEDLECSEETSSEQIKFEKNKEPLVFTCKYDKKHPGGLSGGPVFTKNGELIGVVSSAVVDSKSLKKSLESNPWSSLFVDVDNIDYKKIKACHKKYGNYIFVSPMGEAVLSKDYRDLLN